jgi:cytochrome P450
MKNIDQAHTEALDFLLEFDSTEECKRYDLVQEWLGSDKRLAFFEALRKERPVLVTPECTFVANFVDVRDMLQMPTIFSVDLFKPKMGVKEDDPCSGYLMAHDDDALHYREKSIMQGLLNRDDLPEVRKMVASHAANILKKANGKIELVNAYSRIVPVLLVQDYFGLDGIDKENLIRWSYWNQYDAFNNQPIDNLSDIERQIILNEHEKASTELAAYILALMTLKLLSIKLLQPILNILSFPKRILYKSLGKTYVKKRQNMVARMVKTKFSHEVDFPIARIGTNAGGLLIGSIETTSQAVTQVIQFFIENTYLLKTATSLASGADTRAFDSYVWEALRFVPIRPDIFRLCKENHTIGKSTGYEIEIKKGTIVRLLTQSAMFDDAAYQEPKAFNPDRTFYHNFTFGFGPHECLGKHIGMQLIPEMVRQVLMLADITSDEKISYINQEHLPNRHGPFPENYNINWKQR